MGRNAGTSWSEKLQCHVDEDADYGNTYVRSLHSSHDWNSPLQNPKSVVQSRLDPFARGQTYLDMARLHRILDNCRSVIWDQCGIPALSRTQVSTRRDGQSDLPFSLLALASVSRWGSWWLRRSLLRFLPLLRDGLDHISI